MTTDAETLPTMARLILSERGHSKVCYPLENVAQRIDETSLNIKRKVRFYKWSGLIFLILIPLVSTALSLCVAEKVDGVGGISIVKTLTYFLTFVTVLNGIFRPSERFKQLCSMGIKVERFRSDFLATLETLSEVQESTLHALSEKLSKDFVPYQEQLIGFFLPEIAERGSPSAGGGTHTLPKAKPHAGGHTHAHAPARS